MEPEKKIAYALQTALDKAIDQYQEQLKKNGKLKENSERWKYFIESERNKIKTVASIQSGLAKYRLQLRKWILKIAKMMNTILKDWLIICVLRGWESLVHIGTLTPSYLVDTRKPGN